VTPLGCQTARSRRIAANGLSLHLLEAGPPGRAPVLLLHGGAAHAHWFDAVLPALADRHHVVALDQRGHGESAWAVPPAYATQDFAADLRALVHELGWERAAVVGHSMGGHNAMAFAAWHPERVERLVVVDARPSIPADRVEQMHARGRRPRRVHPTLDAAVGSFRLLPADTAADPALLAHLARASVAEHDGGWSLRFDPACYGARQPIDVWPLLPRIGAPTLVVRGEKSPILPREMAERLRDGVPGATLEEVPGAWHHLVLDRPEAFAATLLRFLERGR
jgi:pimeloyl-ACP methyl ester carboxylesterase